MIPTRYQCTYCEQKFDDEGQLHMHLWVHHKERIFDDHVHQHIRRTLG